MLYAKVLLDEETLHYLGNILDVLPLPPYPPPSKACTNIQGCHGYIYNKSRKFILTDSINDPAANLSISYINDDSPGEPQLEQLKLNK